MNYRDAFVFRYCDAVFVFFSRRDVGGALFWVVDGISQIVGLNIALFVRHFSTTTRSKKLKHKWTILNVNIYQLLSVPSSLKLVVATSLRNIISDGDSALLLTNFVFGHFEFGQKGIGGEGVKRVLVNIKHAAKHQGQSHCLLLPTALENPPRVLDRRLMLRISVNETKKN